MATQSIQPSASISMHKGNAAISAGRAVINNGSSNTVKQADVAGTTNFAGIAANDAAATDTEIAVYTPASGRVPCVSGAAITINTELSYDNTGKVVAATSGKYVIGVSTMAVSAADLWVEVQLGSQGIVKA